MKALPKIRRRSFLQKSGQLLLGFSLLPMGACTGLFSDNADTLPPVLSDKPAINSWIRLDADGYLTVLTGKMELGQGIQTALMQMAAEELDIDMKRVRIIIANTDETPDERYTSGSASIESSGKAIRLAAAEARQILLLMAAERLRVAPEALAVEDGQVFLKDDKNSAVSYWELLDGKQIEGEVSGSAPLKDPADYKLVGKAVHREDILAMATGMEVYVQDIRLPNMVHGRVLRPPTYEAKLLSLPEAEVRAMPGVLKLIRNGSFVGIIANEEYEAIRALKVLQTAAEWETKPLPSQSTLFESMLSERDVAEEAEASGDLMERQNAASKVMEASYLRPYQMHGSIGPSCAIALWDNDELTIWSHTQGVFPLRKSIAAMLDLTEDKTHVKGVPGSGCYGHNGADDAAADAALLAMQLPGKPVRLQWMREDEHAWEPYGSAMRLHIKAGLDADNHINSWHTSIWSDAHSTRPGGNAGQLLPARYLENPFDQPGSGYSGGTYRNAKPIYQIPAHKIDVHNFKGPLRTSALRGLGAYANVFALESFMDELAYAVNENPIAFRLKHLEDKRAIAVIEAIQPKMDTAAANEGWGFAFAQYKNQAAYFAIAAKIAYDKEAQSVRIIKMIGAIDAGQTINPDGLKNQTEGGMIQSASWTLMEQVKYDAAGITSQNWESYPIMRFSEVPEVEVIIIDRPEEKPLGAGEAAQGPTAAALANAVFAAAGKRVRKLPLKEYIKNA